MRELLASEWRVLGVGWPVFGWGLAALGLVIAVAGVVQVGRRLGDALGRRRVIGSALRSLPPRARQSLASGGEVPPTTIPAVNASPGDVAVPDGQPFLFVVRHAETDVFSALRDLAWTRPDLVRVIWDRRWIGERRGNARSVNVERRRGERRRASVPASWAELGFLLVPPTELPPSPAGRGEVLSGPGARSPREPRRTPVAAAVRPAWDRPRLVLGGLLVILVAALVVGLIERRREEREPSSRLVLAPTEAAKPASPDTDPAARAPAPPASASVPGATPARRSEPPPPPGAPALQDDASTVSPVLPATGRPPGGAPARSAGPPASPAPDAPRPAPTAPSGAAPSPEGSRPAQEARTRIRPEECTKPAEPVAVRGAEALLGLWIDVRLDTSAEPARCFYVVRRPDGTLWIVDSGRVQLSRP